MTVPRFLLCLAFLLSLQASAAVKPGAFVVQIHDRSMAVLSPEAKRAVFSVLVENHSLSDQVGKFVVGSRILKFVAVPSGKSEAVEIENKSAAPVVFVPVSPAFQEVPLVFGKKAYEIPPKE
jgi:hypothetical protein